MDAVVDGARRLQCEVYMAFIDIKKAFDSVARDSIQRAMVRMGVPAPLRKGIHNDKLRGSEDNPLI